MPGAITVRGMDFKKVVVELQLWMRKILKTRRSGPLRCQFVGPMTLFGEEWVQLGGSCFCWPAGPRPSLSALKREFPAIVVGGACRRRPGCLLLEREQAGMDGLEIANAGGCLLEN